MLRIAVWITNLLARLAERAIMAFPLATDSDMDEGQGR